MTDQHPLTDEICEELSSCITILKSGDADPYISPFDVEIDMQRAADWRLEKVVEWLKVNLMKHDFHEGYAYLYDDCSNAYITETTLLKDLQKAMRPTTTQEDN